ncbi:MAG: DegT/DnrJ/EryC1/StrS family aminotransferase [Thermoanaerobaculia bacterium]
MTIPMLDLVRQQKTLQPELDAAVAAVMREARYLPAGKWSAFEESLAAYCGRPFAIGVGSGSSALQIALLAAGIRPGDEVITVPNSFFATTEAILLCGATPRFVDVDADTHLMRIDSLDEAIGSRTRTILPVHLFGNVVDVRSIDALLARLGREDVTVIEDCAHAVGGAIDGCRVPVGKIGAFSFNPGKNIGALGDAGAIVTSDDRVALTARLLRDHGRAGKNDHQLVGFNSRLRTLDDAVLALKLPHLDRWNATRRRHAARYTAAFAGSAASPTRTASGVLHATHQYVIRVEARDEVRNRLRDRGVETAIHYPTLIVDQPPLRRLGWSGDRFPVAAGLNESMLSIPCFPELEEAEVAQVIESVLAAITDVGTEEGAA